MNSDCVDRVVEELNRNDVELVVDDDVDVVVVVEEKR